MKPANARAGAPAESAERRARAEGNAGLAHAVRAQARGAALSRLDRVRDVARTRKGEKFTTLTTYLDVEMLRFAYGELKHDAAPGVDGVAWRDYGEGLDERLADLKDRLHRGSYRAQPSRRHFIPKSDGRLRPLGIASLEDKIVQRAVVEILNAIFEEDFLDCSYGFRPGRGQHDALGAVAVGIGDGKVNWILDADIRAFFDSIDHGWMMRFLEHRIGDGRILRLIRKWLTVGVMDETGTRQPATVGSPQGAVISPLLANLYLHHVYDLWARQWHGRHATGAMLVVRYADDTVVGFEHLDDAERFLQDLRQRMAKFALELHPEKTRLIEFGKRAAANRAARKAGKPETFDFLGFTHICGRSRRGGFLLLRHTRRKSMLGKLEEVKEELRRRWHQRIPEQGTWLGQVVRGFNQSFGVPTNIKALGSFRYHVSVLWCRALRRRSQKDRTAWDKVGRLTEAYLPMPRICRPWPDRIGSRAS
jgi:group II intron reverse transcriptase/maturase